MLQSATDGQFVDFAWQIPTGHKVDQKRVGSRHKVPTQAIYCEVRCLIPNSGYIGSCATKVAHGTRGGIVRYQSPEVFDLGSIVGHTYDEPGDPPKGPPVEPFHLDKFCEFSGGTARDAENC